MDASGSSESIHAGGSRRPYRRSGSSVVGDRCRAPAPPFAPAQTEVSALRWADVVAAGRKNASNRPKFLRAVDGEVAGLDLVAHLEEQRALPAAAVRHAVLADERLQRRRGEVERRMGRNAAASRRAVFAVGPTSPRPARRRTSSCSETARRTGSARRAARPSARSGPSGRPASSSPGRTGPRAAPPPARLTAVGPSTRRRRRRDRAAPRRAGGSGERSGRRPGVAP